jgi:hypothetical protein
MKDSKYFVGVLSGVVIALLLVLILSVNQPSPVLAQAAGLPGGHVTAVPWPSKQGDPILFLVDSQEEVVLTYIVYQTKGRLTYPLEFLAARSYKWDKKAESFNNSGPTVKSVREQVLKKEEISEEGSK